MPYSIPIIHTVVLRSTLILPLRNALYPYNGTLGGHIIDDASPPFDSPREAQQRMVIAVHCASPSMLWLR